MREAYCKFFCCCCSGLVVLLVECPELPCYVREIIIGMCYADWFIRSVYTVEELYSSYYQIGLVLATAKMGKISTSFLFPPLPFLFFSYITWVF